MKSEDRNLEPADDKQNFTAETARELLGDPVQISSVRTRLDAEGKAFDLYKETATVLAVISHMYAGDSPQEMALKRDQAICAGLLVRIVKFMTVVLQLAASNDDRGEVVLALNRCITESAVNLEFLATENSDKHFSQFVEHSLGPERQLYDVIQKNIAERDGKVWPIETRMLKSIDRACRLSGLKIEDVKPKYPEWGLNLRERLKALGKEDMYLFLQRIPSHAIHGSWVDILLHYVVEDDSGLRFAPKTDWSSIDARLLLPLAIFALSSAEAYVLTYFSTYQGISVITDRIRDLTNRLYELDQMHESLLAKQ